ncbi:5-formyltetrahydrofolate cyclo-ligase [Actinomadura livida]|uniref:5-formyltetrahydrofolate cyclo-ligase n=1 Tax=Actinomadura livida TaxID=79909 RepID=A0A7W7IIX6_9ACTN|nr:MULTISPECIES: 5-formyltetrahydrofolate cyclo-ligase [Actinomadura]MBB4777811.1 5-formyltetrahydrofolate cyclo-ligase [Actinomadura catellatispora]GGT98533.1 5-formyltetrahydrofolate cyclo-ligase [Actinomadura livida]
MQDIVSKSDLRAELRRRRAAMTPDDRAAAGRSIRDALLSVPEVEMAGTIAAYVSIGTEPDTRGLLFALWKRGAYVILPRVLPDGDLDWASYEGPDSLVEGPRGCLEPSEPSRGPGAVASADVVIVPALATDRTGMRLGRGGGSYDRALARVGPAILTVAPLYDSEVLPTVPAEPHDRRVRAAATPSDGMLRFG